MESLLRWSIEQSSSPANGSQPSRNQQPLDPGVIDVILGKPDSELMKSAMSVAVDENRSEDERVAALDDLEMVCLDP